MKHLVSLLAVLCAIALPVVAHADYIRTYYLSGTTIAPELGNQLGTVGGTVTFKSSGEVQSIDFNFTTPLLGYVSTKDETSVNYQAPGGNTELFEDFNLNIPNNNRHPSIDLFLPGGTIIYGTRSYQGGPVCSRTNVCPGGEISSGQELLWNFYFVDGQLSSVPPAVPEPSSLVLLGTGTLGAIAAARRRFLHA